MYLLYLVGYRCLPYLPTGQKVCESHLFGENKLKSYHCTHKVNVFERDEADVHITFMSFFFGGGGKRHVGPPSEVLGGAMAGLPPPLDPPVPNWCPERCAKFFCRYSNKWRSYSTKTEGGGSDPTPPGGGGLRYILMKQYISEHYITVLTRAPLGYSAERAPLGGGQILPPLPNSRPYRRSEAGEAAIESPER